MNHYAPIERELPANIDAEQALLGAILVNNAAFFDAGRISPEEFYEPVHREAYAIMADLIEGGKKADPVTMNGYLKGTIVGDMPFPVYLARLAGSATSISGTKSYAQAVRTCFQQRQAIAAADRLRTAAYDWSDPTSAAPILLDCEAELRRIQFGESGDVKTIGEFASEAIEATENAHKNDRPPGYDTGLQTLDALIGRLMPGDMVTILAQSGGGKTALLTQILDHFVEPSLDAPKPVLMIQQEMKGAGIARRLLSRHSGVSVRQQKEGDIDEAEYAGIVSASQTIGKRPLYILDRGRQTMTEIESRCRAMSNLQGLGAFGIDHAKFIKAEERRHSVVDIISDAAPRIKDLASELNCVGILLAQVVRDRNRDFRDIRPKISDAYGGEVIRECSDIVIGVSNPSATLPGLEPPKEASRDGEPCKAWQQWLEMAESWRGYAEVAALKGRDGGNTGWHRVAFDGKRTWFEDEER
ncbi:replicative DNA helicase [Bauldia litoralis]|uniref:replicative DNA helicase n=1 Tax=Bauldia litoralis TaxID=665467 RepID=UPI003264CC39